MVSRQSKRHASKRAMALIKATAGKSSKSRKLRIPKTPLKGWGANWPKRIASARKAWGLLKIIGYADNSIGKFNSLGDGDKELVMKHLILGSCKLIHEHGANLVPADMEYYSKTGMPDADRALLRGAKLSMAEESIHGEKGTDTTSEPERDNNGRIIHGKPRWPPNVAICRRPLEVDENGRVDLQHDPYCLRDHFTTRWGVLKEHVSRAPQGGGIIEWSDYNLSIEAEGEDAGLGVNTDVPFRSREAYEKRVSLVDLISSPLLLYRVTANFAAPPQTHNAAYKQAWSFTLWNVEDPKCYLVIEESKGVPQAYFCGGKKASAEACQLLEWLTGTNCPHPYDYTPCGRYA